MAKTKGARKRTDDEIAAILMFRATHSAAETSEEFGVSRQAVTAWRAKHSPSVAAKLEENGRRISGAPWKRQLVETIESTLRFLQKAAQDPNHDPKQVEAQAKALNALHEVHVTSEMFDARRADAARQSGAQAGQMGAGDHRDNIAALAAHPLGQRLHS